MVLRIPRGILLLLFVLFAIGQIRILPVTGGIAIKIRVFEQIGSLTRG